MERKKRQRAGIYLLLAAVLILTGTTGREDARHADREYWLPVGLTQDGQAKQPLVRGVQTQAGEGLLTGVGTYAGEAAGQKEAVSESERALRIVRRNVEQADSVRSGVHLEMGAQVFSLDVKAGAAVTMTTVREPFVTRAESELDLGILGDCTLSVYGFQKEGEEYYRRVLTDGKKARARYAAPEELSPYNGLELWEVLLDWLEEPVYLGKQEDVKEYYVFSGKLTGAGQEAVLSENGTLEPILQLLENHKIAATLGTHLKENEEQMVALMRQSEPMEVTLWVDAGTGYPVQCVADVSDMLGDALGKLTGGQEEKKTPWSGLCLTGAKITVTAEGFNCTKVPEIPEAFYR